MPRKYSDETFNNVKSQYLRRVKVPDIARETKVPKRTIYEWAKSGQWDDLLPVEDLVDAFRRKIKALIDKPDFTEGDANAVARLQELLHKEERHRHAIPTGSAAVILQGAQQRQAALPLDDERVADGKRRSRKKGKVKNDFRGIDADTVLAKFKEGMFGYQLREWEQREHRERFYLKSRQIGWTFYCAREAFADALLTGRNKAFLSASKAQSRLFKRYITAFALEWFDIEIKGGDEVSIMTDHGLVTFWFLSTNSNTAQGPSGDVYLDEVFWIRDFKKLKDLAGAIASHKHYRKVYFSTPSTKSHDAYRLWSGEDYKKIQAARPEFAPFDMPTDKELHQGVVGADLMYRRIIDIDDAMAGGCDLFDMDQLLRENLPEIFDQLYKCKFIDDTGSAFNLLTLLKCAVSDARWPGFKPHEDRPFGERPVAIGYDPARTRDTAEVVVLGMPAKPGGRFIVLERLSFVGKSWEYQAEQIEKLIGRYNVQHVGIDCTGPGNGVFEQVQKAFPRAVPIHYSVDVKTRLVLKAQSIIDGGRIQWSAEFNDIPMAFMAIKRECRGNVISFVAARDKNIGHADVAWSIMHALAVEQLTSNGRSKSSTWATQKEAA